MDFSTFEKLNCGPDLRVYTKEFGKYNLFIYLGEWLLFHLGSTITKSSKPRSIYLDLNEYNELLIEIINNDSVIGDSILQKNQDVLIDAFITPMNLTPWRDYLYHAYIVSVSELEKVYNNLDRVANRLPVKQEKKCKNKTCEKKNDLGANTCWWCGISNPTIED